jgi:predicted esterase
MKKLSGAARLALVFGVAVARRMVVGLVSGPRRTPPVAPPSATAPAACNLGNDPRSLEGEGFAATEASLCFWGDGYVRALAWKELRQVTVGITDRPAVLVRTYDQAVYTAALPGRELDSKARAFAALHGTKPTVDLGAPPVEREPPPLPAESLLPHLPADATWEALMKLPRDEAQEEAVRWAHDNRFELEGTVGTLFTGSAGEAARKKIGDYRVFWDTQRDVAADITFVAPAPEEQPAGQPQPGPSKAFPIVLWTHGYHSNGELPDVQALADAHQVVFIGIPATFEDRANAHTWSEDPRLDAAHIDAALARAAKGLAAQGIPIDLDRRAVFGFSQGGLVAANLLRTDPRRYRGAYAFSPGGFLKTLTEIAGDAAPSPAAAPVPAAKSPGAGALAGHLFLADCGDHEHPLTQARTEELGALARMLGATVTVTRFPNDGSHTFPPDWQRKLDRFLATVFPSAVP